MFTIGTSFHSFDEFLQLDPSFTHSFSTELLQLCMAVVCSFNIVLALTRGFCNCENVAAGAVAVVVLAQ